jgi:hypothetical protein
LIMTQTAEAPVQDKADEALDFYENVRRQVVTDLSGRGIPQDPRQLGLLLQAVDGGSRVALGRKKVAAEEEGNRVNGNLADTMAEILRTNLTSAQKRDRGQPLDEVPVPTLVPGETDQGVKEVRYSQMRPSSVEIPPA